MPQGNFHRATKGTCSRTFMRTFGTNETKTGTVALGGRNSRPVGYLQLREWIGVMQQAHSMEYFAKVRNNKLNAHITTWVEFKGLTLTKKNQKQNEFQTLTLFTCKKSTCTKTHILQIPKQKVSIRHIRIFPQVEEAERNDREDISINRNK